MNGPGVWTAPQRQYHPLRVPAEGTIWSFRWDPRTLWIQTEGATALQDHVGAVALSWQETRAPRGATDGSYNAKRRRPPTINRRNERSPCRQQARGSTTVAATPNGSTNTQRWGSALGGSSQWRTRCQRDGGLLLWHGASRRAKAGISKPLVLFFFGPPGHEKGKNPISLGLSPVRRKHMAVERARTGWNSIPCLADVGHAKGKIKINVFPVSIHQNTLKHQIKLDKCKINEILLSILYEYV